MALRALRRLPSLIWLLVGAATCGAFTVPTPARAEGDTHERSLVLEKMKNERRLALVIGNGGYTSGALKNPPGDARLMKQTLEGLGFEVMLLVDASQDEMKRAINEFGDRLDSLDERGGVALFYYAGHGLQVDGHNYLVPTSARIKGKRDIDVETIDIDRVLAKMDQAKSRLNVVILDACRNNPFLSDKRAINPGLAQPGSARGTVIAYATGPNSVADDGEGTNSVYTRALADAMAEPGLELNEVFQTVRERVLASTDRRQTPWESSSKVGQFFFKPGSIPTGRLSSSMGAAAPGRVGVSLEVELGPSIGLLTGGDAAGSSSLPFGFQGRVHGNYVFSSGLAVGIHAGYLLSYRTLSDGPLTLTSRGKPPTTATIEENQRLGGFLAGLEALYTSAGDWPLTGRLNAGLLLGSLRDRRTGDFKDSSGAGFPLDSSQSAGATYLYVAPEFRFGHRFGEHFELNAGAVVYVLGALATPTWDGTKTVPAGGDGIASSPTQNLLGGLMLVVSPSMVARYQF